MLEEDLRVLLGQASFCFSCTLVLVAACRLQTCNRRSQALTLLHAPTYCVLCAFAKLCAPAEQRSSKQVRSNSRAKKDPRLMCNSRNKSAGRDVYPPTRRAAPRCANCASCDALPVHRLMSDERKAQSPSPIDAEIRDGQGDTVRLRPAGSRDVLVRCNHHSRAERARVKEGTGHG